jgi:hypothetical protein
MRCIFCLQERPASEEHVFPLAIGGRLTTDRVCHSCNSMLGSRVDSALSDYLPVRQRRAELGLAGNSEAPPMPFEMLLGVATLAGHHERRIETRYDATTGKLDHRLLHHAADVVMSDGTKVRQISVDVRDKDQIPKIIQRERRRHGKPPLSEYELAAEFRKAMQNVTTIENLAIRKDLIVSFAYLRHAMMKIAYELAFLWLGESYLDDPSAVELRTAICASDIASTDGIVGYVGECNGCTPLEFWTPNSAHHLAYATRLLNHQIVITVRIFDIYAAVVPVTNEASRYLKALSDPKLRFLVINATTGKMWNTSFRDEQHRLALAMTAAGHTPPFPDPLAVYLVGKKQV